MSITPYNNFPDSSFWRKSVSSMDYESIDPLIGFDVSISKDTKVATAGSCFAQHIARYLKLNNFNYYISEAGHTFLSKDIKEKYNYGTFSARYGNLYTSRQLLQLFKRAFDKHQPTEDIWQENENQYIDPFRPNIQPGGFSCLKEFEIDRKQHFNAVRNLFETLDVFVFTLGLTECWAHNDGTVFPLCPGVAGGVFDKNKHMFLNLDVDDVVADINEFMTLLKSVNSRAKVILTVSPVPLIATATENHVLVSTAYSKAVLRVAAEKICQENIDVSYFPSFEIITGSFSQGRYFADDFRSVTEEGVQHVMRTFFKHATNEKMNTADTEIKNKPVDSFLKKMKNIVDVICEESLIDKSNEKTK